LAIALSILASPLLAALLAIPLFLAFLVYVGLSRRADEPAAGEASTPRTGDSSGGVWGER